MSFDIPILVYHHIGDEPRAPWYAISLVAFRRQLDFLLRAGYTAITCSRLMDIVEGRTKRTGREVVLTFDDGLRSSVTTALPELTARRMTATAFIVAGRLGGFNDWDAHQMGYQRRPLVSAANLESILHAGVEIGVHGWLHRDLTTCSADELWQEIVLPKRFLEDRFGIAVCSFSYPYGKHRPDHADALRSAGYRCAVTLFSAERYVTSNPYAMRRINVHAGDNMLRFRVKLSRAYLRLCAFRGIPGSQVEAVRNRR